MPSSFNADIVNAVDHRAWDMPARPWMMTQTWHDLLFAHWPVDVRRLRAKVPSAFELDLFDGVAWIGIVPFHMSNVAPRLVPSLPRISAFPELNVRTYVRVGDRPGVYFFSLDAGSPIAVRAARTLLNLPYHSASMTAEQDGVNIRYSSRRFATDPGAEFIARYGPTGPAHPVRQGSLEYFLTERYCLYNINRRGRPCRLEIHHPPWLLEPAQADIERNTMALVNGFDLPGVPPLLHFAKRQDAVAWLPTALT